jgi:4-hydroxy 2-oxovalerate aldolase
MEIQLLDCTLRDGAHVNSGKFGYQHITNVISNLSNSYLDVVEIGFLKHCAYSPDISYFPHIENAYDILAQIPNRQNIEYSLMARADEFDINELSECTGKINYIRLAFYYDFLEGAIKAAKEVIARGYRCFLNLINTPGCTHQELNDLIIRVNKIKPYALTIVDTFGVLIKQELETILDEYAAKLDPTIRIGFHCHENLSLSFSLAQFFVELMYGSRNIIVDGSLLGMGRIPGNLCIEMIADYLNNNYGKKYDLAKILSSIEDDIAPIKMAIPWGYSPAYFLSARQMVHRSYSEYLLQQKFRLDQIESILMYVKPEYSVKFNKSHIDSIIAENFCNLSVDVQS